MVKVNRLVVSGADFKRLDEEERLFVLMAGHLANELHALNKLLAYLSRDYANEIVQKAQTTWFLILLRVLAGKLIEAWSSLSACYFGNRVSSLHANRPYQEFQPHLQQLKAYFSHTNLLHEIRTRFAFHYSSDDVLKRVQQLDEDEELEMFLSSRRGNCVYYFSEATVSGALLELTGLTDSEAALDHVVAEVTEVAGVFFNFLNASIGGAFYHLRDLGAEVLLTDAVTIDPAPKFADIVVPVFTEEG